jgi:tetratricopeptide (TPR) repeat protein
MMIRRFTTTVLLMLSAAGLAWAVRAATPETDAARETAYRENNLGVAFLEQFDHEEAAEAFARALEADPDFALAQVNHVIALFYVPDFEAAKAAAAKTLAKQPDSLHLHYILTLIARLEDQPQVAEAHLKKVLAADPTDFGANFVYGQLLLDEQRYDEALSVLEVAAQADPVNASAAYTRAMALGRSGRREEGMKAMERFQELRENPARTSFGKLYLEQGRYAQAVASTGAEGELVDRRTPRVSFRPGDEGAVPARADAGAAVTLALTDLDGDGRLDAVEATGETVRLLKNEGGRFTDITRASGVSGPARAAVGGDYDNDGQVDLLVVRPEGLSLYRGEGGGRFVDATAAAGLPARAGLPATAAFADVDHDGDLDVFVPDLLLRNNGDGTFADVSGEANIATEGEALAVVPTDFDNGRDLDLVVLRRAKAPRLFRNLRDGSFEDVAERVGVGGDGSFLSIAAGDINKDFYTDLVLGKKGASSSLALSDGQGGFEVRPGPEESGGAEAVQAFDYDNDGLLDLLFITPNGPRLFRNLGNEWVDVTGSTFPRGLEEVRRAALGVADLDGDGDADILVAAPAETRLWVNEGGQLNRSVAIDLAGRVSNKGAVGAKVALRAGSLKQKIETSAAVPMVAPADVLFGLGPRPAPDTVRVIWVSGIVQTETDFPNLSRQGTRTAIGLLELDRKPSSCPYLYAWDGDRFAFVTDFLGAGEMGYWVAPGVRSHPDPVEYVRISPGQLRERDGRYELRVTNELEEVLYLDQVQLLAVEHPADVEIYPDEGMTGTPKEFRLFAVKDARVPAVADAAGEDATARARSVDQLFVEGFGLRRIRGYAAEHALTLDLAALPATHRLLLLTGWTDYAFSSDNVAASQMGLGLQPPRLEVEASPGRWEVAVPDVGIPVGRPQTVVVDLSSVTLGPTLRVRLVTNMRIYWDRVAVGESTDRLAVEPVALDPGVAWLSERGFSAERFVDGKGPLSFDYSRVSRASPWKVMPGRYTAEGDVRTLLGAADDLFAVTKPGDEIALSFTALPAPEPGRARTFLLRGDGFSKEMDINSASPDVVLPLPYHGMARYPYPDSERPRALARRDELQAKHNTRVVARPLVPLELAALLRRDAADHVR